MMILEFSCDAVDLLSAERLEEACCRAPAGDVTALDAMMSVTEVTHGLMALYEHLAASHSNIVNVPLAIDLTLNWLLNVYDQ